MQLGIDIGTHAARAAYLDSGGRPQLVQFAAGVTSLPALARQTMHGLVIGQEAARALVGNAETTIVGCTRLMGRAGEIPAPLLARLPYAVREIGGEATCNLLFAEVRASEAFGRIVRALADAAAQSLGEAIEGVILTVPAGAEDRFRVQARTAVEAQGLRVVRLINQPTAAVLALGPGVGKLVAVVSCGGGTTEVSLAERSPQGVRIRAVAADPLLGGDDMAWAVAEQLNTRFQHNEGIDVFAVGDSRAAAQGLWAATKDVLEQLHDAPQAQLVLDHGGGFGRDLAMLVRRREVEHWLQPLVSRIAVLCRRVLSTAGVRARDVESVVLIGDETALPLVRAVIARAFDRDVAALHTTDAQALAAYGAALVGADGAPSVWDVTPYPLGINCYYAEEELFSPIIRANTPIPTPPVGSQGAHTESYCTRYPDQTNVRLDVLQYRGPLDANPRGVGRVRPDACEKLGSWEFSGLQPKPGREAPFTVTFAVDQDGILQLFARETETGHTLTAQIERGLG
ncbi:MAG: Hsp70 family protein [Roseiflexaceae bacterium]|nr:Hsp70 family protein [Roseiflexaceae bacterium]